MTVPNLNSPANTNQASCLDLIPASQLVVEPICSWRLSDPQLELKVSSDGKNIRYSVYNHHPSEKCYWLNSAFSSKYLTSVFKHCVWKGIQDEIESRLFSDGHRSVLLSVNLDTEKVGIKKCGKDFNDFLITRDPIISAVNDDNSLELQEEMRKTPRNRPYDPEAEEGMTRWRRTAEGDQVMFEGNPISEKTIKVWSGFRDIRLIKFISGQREEILCRVFNWETKENPEIYSRFAPDAAPSDLPYARYRKLNIDDALEYTQGCMPQLENTKNKELITFYREHPLNYFMPDYVLSRAEASEVQRWVCAQFYRNEGENKTHFEYTNFVKARKMPFSFSKNKKNSSKHSLEIETWHIEMKRQASWILQFPIGIGNFFAGIFLASAQNPAIADKKAMKKLVQGVPIIDEERNKIVNDFTVELGNCSVINFYIACDRSTSELEVNGRTWVKSFANAGRDTREAVMHTAEGLVQLFGRVDLEGANRAVGNAAAFVENANRFREGFQVLRGVPPPPPQNNPENE